MSGNAYYRVRKPIPVLGQFQTEGSTKQCQLTMLA